MSAVISAQPMFLIISIIFAGFLEQKDKKAGWPDKIRCFLNTHFYRSFHKKLSK
jgi:hypothetical protein